mgnify:CR=1 FL=1
MSIAGLLIRRERLARGWSQEGLCRGICTASYLSKIEQGRAEASDEVRELLFARLGLSWTQDLDGALHTRTEECMEALLSGSGAAFKAAFELLRAEEERFLGSPCAADYLLLRAFACENEEERYPLDAEFVPFLDQRQLALQRALEERYEEAVLLYPAPVLRLWQGASLYARGSYAAAIETLRAACDAAAGEGLVYVMLNGRLYLGNCYSDLGDFERMQRHYAVALRLAAALGDDDAQATVRYNTAATQIERGDFAAAYAYFSALKEPNAIALHKLAICCEALGRREEAFAALDRADALPGGGDTVEREMLALVRYRLAHPKYLHDERYGALLTGCFSRLRRERGAGYARFHLPWMLAWYKANRQYRQACLLLEEFPEIK